MYQASVTLFMLFLNQMVQYQGNVAASPGRRTLDEGLIRDQRIFPDTFSRKWIQVPSRMIESHEHELKLSDPHEVSSSKDEEPLSSSASTEHEDIVTGEGKSEGVIQAEMDDHLYFSPPSDDLKSLPSDEAGEVINSEESRVDDPRTGSQDMLADSTHHGGGGHGGWLDMGAYSGKKGAFGWYADFPVGYG